MTVEETKYGWTFKMNPPCHIYSCANCPYRQGYCCYYGNKDYESYLKGDLNKGIDRMTDKNLIDLNYDELQCLKSAIHQMHKGVIRDLDKESRLRICKRGFEFSNEKTGKTFQVILEIKELKE